MKPRTGFMRMRAQRLMIDTCSVTRTGAEYPCWLDQGTARPKYLQPEGTPIELYRLLTLPRADIVAGDTFTHNGSLFVVTLAEQPPPTSNLVQRTFLCYLASTADGTSALVVANATVRGIKSDNTTVRYDSRRVGIYVQAAPTDSDSPSGLTFPGNYMVDVAESTWVAQDKIQVLQIDGQPHISDSNILLLKVVDRPGGADARVVALLDGDFRHRVVGP